MAKSSKRPEHEEYLRPTAFIDCDHPEVIEFAKTTTATQETDVAKAIALYDAVRDGIRYDPYRVDLSPQAMRASAVLARRFGFCVPKAVLLAAAARAEGIPSRLGFADVKNHLATDKLKESMQTDLFVFHAYTELFLDEQWVKATPAFNSSLCERFDVEPLPFDGHNDSLLQQFDRSGNRYMEYVRDRGQFSDLPLEQLSAAFLKHYPSLMSEKTYDIEGTFEEDA